LAVLLGLGCGSARTESGAVNTTSSTTEVVQFAYETTQGQIFGSNTTRGRVTIVLFATTFDMASEWLATLINRILHEHRPRINAGLVILEAPEHAILAETFRASLKLSYPVAMADSETLSGQSPFGRISSVPTFFVLDRKGRIVWRRAGIAQRSEIVEALHSAAER
jgi:hypothetical protein